MFIYLMTFNTILVIIILFITLFKSKPASKPIYYKPSTASSCSAETCGATDPVSDPMYNMREIAKQSILLEEHLVEKNKYCRDCIIKHFLHIIGLSEEAQMLAGNRINNYPLLEDSAKFYRTNMDNWLENSNINKEKSNLEIATVLREFRKDIIAIYYPITPLK